MLLVLPFITASKALLFFGFWRTIRRWPSSPLLQLLFFKALPGAFVPVEETAILSTTNDRCSRLILRSSPPWAAVNYTNVSTTATENISQLRDRHDLFL